MSVNYRVKQRLQAALAQQSGGLIGLVNLFKKYDTDGSGSLSWEEFCSALQKCGLAPSPQDIRAIFLDLDKDGNNEISYPEFVQVMRGEMSNQRKALIKRIFDSIDEDGDGVISMTDLGKCFNPKNHPDVRNGRSTVNVLLKDFFESFATVSKTGYVSLSQFMEYYANSAAFEDDLKFTETMNSIWNIKSSSKGSSTPTLRSTTSLYSSTGVGSLISEGNAGAQDYLVQLREQLKSRGARGFVGLQRKFKIMDDDGNRSLNLVEFKKGIKESGLNLTDLQISQLFTTFDRDRNGAVDFDEFLATVRVSPELFVCTR
jgi:Ca2+-binding EF-hand superfamily protein